MSDTGELARVVDGCSPPTRSWSTNTAPARKGVQRAGRAGMKAPRGQANPAQVNALLRRSSAEPARVGRQQAGLASATARRRSPRRWRRPVAACGRDRAAGGPSEPGGAPAHSSSGAPVRRRRARRSGRPPPPGSGSAALRRQRGVVGVDLRLQLRGMRLARVELGLFQERLALGGERATRGSEWRTRCGRRRAPARARLPMRRLVRDSAPSGCGRAGARCCAASRSAAASRSRSSFGALLGGQRGRHDRFSEPSAFEHPLLAGRHSESGGPRSGACRSRRCSCRCRAARRRPAPSAPTPQRRHQRRARCGDPEAQSADSSTFFISDSIAFAVARPRRGARQRRIGTRVEILQQVGEGRDREHRHALARCANPATADFTRASPLDAAALHPVERDQHRDRLGAGRADEVDRLALRGAVGDDIVDDDDAAGAAARRPAGRLRRALSLPCGCTRTARCVRGAPARRPSPRPA